MFTFTILTVFHDKRGGITGNYVIDIDGTFLLFLLELNIGKEAGIMSEKKKSKTDVAARAQAKNQANLCRFCGNKVEVVMTVFPTGKKKMQRTCCAAA